MTKGKTAAELLREAAARDPEGHKQRLARGYGVGPDVTSPVGAEPDKDCDPGRSETGESRQVAADTAAAQTDGHGGEPSPSGPDHTPPAEPDGFDPLLTEIAERAAYLKRAPFSSDAYHDGVWMQQLLD